MAGLTARPLPAFLARYHEIGGVLDFVDFDGCPDVDPAQPIDQYFAGDASYRGEALRALPRRTLDRRSFLGSRWDEALGALRLPEIGDRAARAHAPLELPEIGAGGDFAYAFSDPPYPLRTEPEEIRSLFRAALDHILPPGREHEIIDWSSPELVKVSELFLDGMEWWGVFLFTIRVPALSRITVICGSSTD